MTDVKADLWYPVIDGTPAKARIDRTSNTAISSGGEFSFTGLTPGTRKLLVYGGLIHNPGSGVEQTNCWSSGLQTIELKPGGNVVTVYLTEELN
jgi:hypothetical protein